MGSPYSHHHSSNLHYSSKISNNQNPNCTTTTINPHISILMASQKDIQPIEPNFQFHFTNLTHTLIPQNTLGILLIVIIFSIIFLSACFYFYYHFISHFTHFSSTNTPIAPTNLSSSSSPVPVSQPLGLDPAAISNLPIFLHRSQAIPDIENGSCGSVFRESECSICLGLFEDGEIIKVLPKCQHAYHSECVDKWLSARSSCPLCRASLLVDQQSLHVDS